MYTRIDTFHMYIREHPWLSLLRIYFTLQSIPAPLIADGKVIQSHLHYLERSSLCKYCYVSLSL